MAKREVNAISRGRAAKGKREASQRTTYTTAGGAQQYHNKDTVLDAVSRIRGSKDPEIHSRASEVFYSAMGKDHPDSLIDYAAREKEAAERGKTYRQKRADREEAQHKLRVNRQSQSVGKFADGGMVGYDAKMARLDYPGTKGVSMPDAGKQQVTGKGFRGTF